MTANPKICATLALCFWWGCIPAQNHVQRVAVVDVRSITESLPEYKQAENYIFSLEKKWRKEIDSLYHLCDSIENEISIRRVMLPTEMISVLQREKKQKKHVADSLAMSYFGTQGLYEREKKRVIEPIIDAIRSEIATYADKNRISVVIDKNDNSVLYFDKNSDISAIILNRLKKNNKKE